MAQNQSLTVYGQFPAQIKKFRRPMTSKVVASTKEMMPIPNV